MRCLTVCFVLMIAGADAKQGCGVRDLLHIAYTFHDPSERHKEMVAWIMRNQNQCRSQDYIVIWNNLSEWAGSADSTQLRGLVIHDFKEALDREKK
jgi:hypothetical protein